MITFGNGIFIDGYGKVNVVLGKNGSGKSTLLRNIHQLLSNKEDCVRYVTPERGGELTYDGNIDTSRASDPGWMENIRRRNRWDQFRQSSVAEFRNLETLVLRSIESDPALRSTSFTFETEIDRINTVLDQVRLKRSGGAGFDILRKGGDAAANASQLSSGESELVSLAIEILVFSYLCKQEKYAEKNNWLLLDEPDVHLHPDLQFRLMKLLSESLTGTNGKVLIATHSSSILSSLCSSNPDVRIGIKIHTNQSLTFRTADDSLKLILPMFGAHPLSNVFNEKPPLILEGEDDERIWQTAVRSSQGRVSVYPCVAGTINHMHELEVAAAEMIEGVYDNARAFSLRDRDEAPYHIDDLGRVTRCRLMCRSAENLILSDDVLAELGITWEALKVSLEAWINQNSSHSRYGDAVSFRNSGWDRQNFPLKNLRMLIVGISGSNKPWEVAVGQAIAKIHVGEFTGPDSLSAYLGPKLITALGLVTSPNP